MPAYGQPELQICPISRVNLQSDGIAMVLVKTAVARALRAFAKAIGICASVAARPLEAAGRPLDAATEWGIRYGVLCG